VYRGTATVAATVTDDLGPVANGQVTFSLARSGDHCTATTDASGLATCTIALSAAETAGVDTITASFAATVDDLAGTATAPFTVTKARLTVTADDRSRLFGTANPALTATLSGFVGGETLATSGVTGSADCSTTAMPFSAVGTYPITCTAGSLAAVNYSFDTFVPGTLTVTATGGCLTGNVGKLTVAAGQAVCLGPGAKVNGPVTVNAGGSLDVEGATISGPVKSTGAGVLRLCGATVSGPLTIAGSTGLVLVGGDAATGACAGNTISGPASLTDNTAGVEFNGNQVHGPLTITGTTGSLPPPDSGSVHAEGNTVNGPIKTK
jgi:hypothetical protein